jgi:ParB family chromosome partitioning protein
MSVQQKNKPRLGRGLSSLISISEIPVEAEVPAKPAAALTQRPPTAPGAPNGSPTELPISQIQPNPHQPRRSFAEASLAELAASIKSTGLIQPIVVRRVGQQYELIAGERRLRAAKLAGLISIPALIRDIDTVTQAQMALIENIQREDLNPIDRAQGYRTLIEQLGLTQAELAGRLGEDRSSIANFLRLLDLADSVKTMVRDGRLSLGHAKLIAGISDILEQERLANLVLLQGLSVRNLERAIKEGPRPETKKPTPTGPAAHLQDLEKTISRQLGLRVQLRAAAKKGKGRLVIHYASLDQFDELLTRLKVSTE